ncbi:MAG: hypothetical protein IPH60_00010 [Flavobacteriales bacterium]|nr:hypothetical protein [Flavobacteriales bacterium]
MSKTIGRNATSPRNSPNCAVRRRVSLRPTSALTLELELDLRSADKGQSGCDLLAHQVDERAVGQHGEQRGSCTALRGKKGKLTVKTAAPTGVYMAFKPSRLAREAGTTPP